MPSSWNSPDHETTVDVLSPLFTDEPAYTTSSELDDIAHINECLSNTLQQARTYYGTVRPDFCVKIPDEYVRQVKLLDSDQVVDIQFKRWDDNSGYWILRGGHGSENSRIIKFMQGKYYCWGGIQEGISRDPIAFAVRRCKRQRQNTYSSSASTCRRSPETSSSLRPRTARQAQPYTMYNLQRKYDDRGVRLSEIELENMMTETMTETMTSSPAPALTIIPSARRCGNVAEGAGSAQSLVSSSAVPLGSTLPDIAKEEVIVDTVFRTQLDGFDHGAIIVSAQKCPTHTAFFAAIKTKWAFKLDSKCTPYCVASFPWLTAERNIVLQEIDHDSYEAVLREVSIALSSEPLVEVEVLVKIYAA